MLNPVSPSGKEPNMRVVLELPKQIPTYKCEKLRSPRQGK